MPRILSNFALKASAAALVTLSLASCALAPNGGGILGDVIEPSLRNAATAAESSYDYRAAANHYRALLERHPNDATIAMSFARNLRFSGSPQEAIEVLKRLNEVHGPNAVALLELGRAHLAADQLNLAVRYLTEAKTLAPGSWEVRSTLGVAHDYSGKHAEAQAEYAEALTLSPDNPAILNNLGLSLAQTGDLDGALAVLRKAVDQPSATAQVRQNLALALALKGDSAAAERLARKDLPPAMAADNAGYYRLLATSAGRK